MSGFALFIGAAMFLAPRQNPAPAAIALPDAIRISEAHSAEVKQAFAAYLAARARGGQIASRRNPHLDFDASVTRYDDRTTVNLPGMNAPFEVAPNNSEALTIALTEDFDISGGIGQAVSQARLEARAAQFEVVAISADQALNTTTAYYAVLRAEQNLRVAVASLDAYREQQGTTTRLYKGGVGQRIDVYRADSQVADAESEVVRRQNDLNSTRSAMNDLLGQPLDAPIALVAPAEAPTAYDTSRRTDLIAQALNRRPEALEASVEVLAAKKGIRVARTTSDPAMLLNLSGNRYPTTSFELPRQNVAALTLTLSIPIYDGGLARAKVDEAKDELTTAQAREDRIRRDIALQVQNAALDAETAQKREAAADVELQAALAARKLAQQRFESQVGLYIEVTDAQSALTAAQAAQVQATYDLLTAQAQLAHAVNDPITK
jgi:outer membrane protein